MMMVPKRLSEWLEECSCYLLRWGRLRKKKVWLEWRVNVFSDTGNNSFPRLKMFVQISLFKMFTFHWIKKTNKQKAKKTLPIAETGNWNWKENIMKQKYSYSKWENEQKAKFSQSAFHLVARFSQINRICYTSSVKLFTLVAFSQAVVSLLPSATRMF